MPETQTYRSALAEAFRPQRLGADGRAVTMAERRGLTLRQIDMLGRPEAGAPTIAGFPLPPPNTASSAGPHTALSMGPKRWLLVSKPQAPDLGLSEAGPLDAVVDLSHGRTILRISGVRARDVLAKGCSLDLHPRSFATDRCAATAIAKMPVLLHQVDDGPTFDLYVNRSYAVSFLEFLTDAALEFGVELVA